MSQDTLNKLIPVVQTSAFGWNVWRHMQRIVYEVALVNRIKIRTVSRAFLNSLNELDPNTPRWLAWQILKNLFGEPRDD